MSTRKQEFGVVVSNKMDKTVTVRVSRLVQHRRYKKFVRRYTTYKAHDEENQCRIGDTVAIVQTRPRSKTKRWKVHEIIQKSAEV